MSRKSRDVAVINTDVFMGAGTEPFTQLKDTDIVIPYIVLNELQKHRSMNDGAGWAARAVLHYIEDLRLRHGGKRLLEGVPSSNGNTVRLEHDHKDTHEVRSKLYLSGPDGDDTIILSVAFNLQNVLNEDHSDSRLTLYTNDLIMRIKADSALGIDTKAWGSDRDKPFTGIASADLSDMGLTEETVTASALREHIDRDDSDASHLLVRATLDGSVAPMPFMLSGGSVQCLCSEKPDHIGRIYAANDEQAAAMKYLKDDSITVVSLGGIAGAGKTLLALAQGMESVSESRRARKYDRILVFRPMYEVGQQKVGFLPGDLDEKMRPWSQAIWDDVEKIDSKGMSGAAERKQRRREKDKETAADPARRDGGRPLSVEDMHPEITISPISWIRGRTIERSFIIVDDAQSLERPLLLDILTRLGESSRIVFTFDMDQQDNPNPHMSPGTSITSVINDFMTDSAFAHIDFTESRRSPIAQKAAGLLRKK